MQRFWHDPKWTKTREEIAPIKALLPFADLQLEIDLLNAGQSAIAVKINFPFSCDICLRINSFHKHTTQSTEQKREGNQFDGGKHKKIIINIKREKFRKRRVLNGEKRKKFRRKENIKHFRYSCFTKGTVCIRKGKDMIQWFSIIFTLHSSDERKQWLIDLNFVKVLFIRKLFVGKASLEETIWCGFWKLWFGKTFPDNQSRTFLKDFI